MRRRLITTTFHRVTVNVKSSLLFHTDNQSRPRILKNVLRGIPWVVWALSVVVGFAGAQGARTRARCKRQVEPRADTLRDLELGIEQPRRERILLSLLQVWNFCFHFALDSRLRVLNARNVGRTKRERQIALSVPQHLFPSLFLSPLSVLAKSDERDRNNDRTEISVLHNSAVLNHSNRQYEIDT